MKWFSNWIYKQVQKARDNEIEDKLGSSKQMAVRPIEDDTINARGMNFTMYKANGGYIVEYRKYDQRKDQWDNKLHIITEDKDLGEELGKIVSFESLRS